MAIRFSEEDVRPMGRTARGVRGINLDAGDEVVGMVVVAGSADAEGIEGADSRPDENAFLLTACENGYGKRTRIQDYRRQNRGGKGLIDIQAGERNGPVIGVSAVLEQHEVMAIASTGKIVRMAVSDISCVGRNTKGVRLVNLEESEKLSAIAPIRDASDAEEDAGEE
jgi:DNA gyrase subunit A